MDKIKEVMGLVDRFGDACEAFGDYQGKANAEDCVKAYGAINSKLRELLEREPLTILQVKALGVCLDSGRVSVSEVQRKLAIPYMDAQTICQQLVDYGGVVDGLEISPNLRAHGIGNESKEM